MKKIALRKLFLLTVVLLLGQSYQAQAQAIPCDLIFKENILIFNGYLVQGSSRTAGAAGLQWKAKDNGVQLGSVKVLSQGIGGQEIEFQVIGGSESVNAFRIALEKDPRSKLTLKQGDVVTFNGNLTSKLKQPLAQLQRSANETEVQLIHTYEGFGEVGFSVVGTPEAIERFSQNIRRNDSLRLKLELAP